MSNAVERFLDAKRRGDDGLLVYIQETADIGPRALFITNLGHALITGERCQAGAIILGAWDTVGFDWIT